MSDGSHKFPHNALAPPEPGYFRLRLVKNGPFVAARISRTCHCTINGGPTNEAHDWQETCDRYPQLFAEINGEKREVYRVWEWGEMIEKSTFDYLTHSADWDRQYAPGSPAANPTKAIDITKMNPILP